MKLRALISQLSLAGLLMVAGCDSVDVSDRHDNSIRPSISVHFVNGTESGGAKSAAILDVELVVTTLSGADYSPEPVQVDNVFESEVVFDLVLPADSVYAFLVRFVDQNDQLVGEGGALQLISETSTQVEIPVVTTGSDPWLAIVPAEIDVPTGSGTLGLTMRYYGGSEGIAGLAAQLSETGPSPIAVEYVDVDLVEVNGSEISLGWAFSAPLPNGVLDVGEIEVPTTSASNFCLEMNPGDAKTVNAEGVITPIGASGVCIHVRD